MGTHADQKEKAVVNILTVDLEDWFHICEVEDLLPQKDWDRLTSMVTADTEKLLKLLHAAGVRATFFVLGYTAQRHPDLIRRIHAMGHEIGYHGWNHELVYRLKPDEFRGILRRGIEKIESLIGRKPLGFRAPQWSVNDLAPWALKILAEEGFLYDSSRVPLKIIGNESYPPHIHRLEVGERFLWEFPPLTLKTPLGRYPGGGGWGLRCLPYLLLRRQVRRLNLHRVPALFFVHPREFGRGPSVPGLPPAKKFVLNAGLWSTTDRLSRLLADFRFTSVGQYLDQLASGLGLAPEVTRQLRGFTG